MQSNRHPVNRTEENPFGIQAQGERYRLAAYLTPKRMSSIGWQLALSEETNGSTFLEVGIGSRLLSSLLTNQGKTVVTVDHNPEIEPDVIGQLPQLPIVDQGVDASLCFQVLEHLPFDYLESCLRELRRVSRRWVLISLPDQTIIVDSRQRIKRAVYERFGFPKRWRPRRRSIRPEHFWELGMDSITYEDILAAASHSDLTTVRYFRNPLEMYHCFFIFERRV